MSTSDWGEGYDVGQAGLLQAIQTAELMATNRERNRIIKLLEEHRWFEKGEQDEILGILDGSYKCECKGCIPLIKGENK